MQKTVLFSLSLTISTHRFHYGMGFSQHSLAILLTFVDKHGKDDPKDQTFRRITKDEMKDQIVEVIPVQRYYGSKKPDMPSS